MNTGRNASDRWLAETGHLGLDYAGRVYLVRPGDTEDCEPLCLGFAGDAEWPDLPREFGPEPGWFAAEARDLGAEWRDAERFRAGCREAERAAYSAAAGRVS